MASAVNRFGVQLVRHSFRTRPRIASNQLIRPAKFHRSACRCDEESPEGSGTRPAKAAKAPQPPASFETPPSAGETPSDGIEREGFLEFPLGTSAEEKTEALEKWEAMLADPPEEDAKYIREFKNMMSAMERDIDKEVGFNDAEELEVDEDFLKDEPPRGVMSVGEEYPDEEGYDEDFQGDDITTLAHGELEQHREIRHYMRLAAWEMPLLSKYAKPFTAPGKDRPLRFRHTSYLGENHPARHKVVLEFCTADLPISPQQRLKLIKLVGQRYDPQKDLVKMSCEMYENSAQNKRYLGDTVNALIKEAKNQSDAEGGKDAFDDVPVDFRHVKWQKRYAFPEEWKMTPDRKKALDGARRERKLAENQRRQQGLLIDGNEIVEAAVGAQDQVVVERTPRAQPKRTLLSRRP